jgi:hypothetical protein
VAEEGDESSLFNCDKVGLQLELSQQFKWEKPAVGEHQQTNRKINRTAGFAVM